MDKIIGNISSFGPNEVTKNHIFTLIALVFIVFILSILIYIAVKKQKVDKAPNVGIIIVESLITTADDFANDLHENRLQKANPYFISIFIFMFFGNLLSLFGLEPVGSSLSVVLAATMVTWITTFIIGIIYQKIKFLLKYLNPLEIAGSTSPLISLTFRMFGNIVGGIVLITLFHTVLNTIWVKWIIKVADDHPGAIINPFGILLTPFLNLYFDIFAGAIQAFVFMILTVSYWSQTSEVDVKEKHKKKIKEWKSEIIKKRQERLQKKTQLT
ncbi:F0F1 ATP synthase subunit A [Metamycoplasma cloacale]|uniref:F0F1 ATP synthase subunit A n=1 Tax=Metamycoplasma cloacale TaxID=92401 RepID=A0A2Z4LLW5_9BACT|nr:F0F1 ATP synthase subunit A [Metamycoplasma cloacale]AWX42690.1 F0F1 ATP synthase subunit A [Metamycoplasma cloacale]VEU79498.1 F0F1 ATP synthase subunit A [Metamycoplasma cloacale]